MAHGNAVTGLCLVEGDNTTLHSAPHLLRTLHERTDPVDVVQLVEFGAEAVQSQAQLLFLWRIRL